MEISTNSKKKSVMDLIRFSLWHEGQACADRETFLEMKQHTVAGLAASALQEMSLPEDLKKEWGLTALMQAANYHKLLYIHQLPLRTGKYYYLFPKLCAWNIVVFLNISYELFHNVNTKQHMF